MVEYFMALIPVLYMYIVMFFDHDKLKKPPSKDAQKYSFLKIAFLPWAAQTAQAEEFMFQNVAYRPTVYKTGAVMSEVGW